MKFSKFIYGCASPIFLNGENADELLDGVLDSGVNVFDTAENYGNGKSESSLGHWIASRNVRDKIFIITKGCHPYAKDRVTPECIDEDISQSFECLKTDYIDVYLLHRDDTKVPVGPLVEKLNEYVAAGKVGRIGASNWTVERIQEANDYAADHGLVPLTVSSPHYSLGVQVVDPYGGSSGCVDISGTGNGAAFAYYKTSRMPVLAYASLCRGLFSGRVHSEDEGNMDRLAGLLDEFAIKGYCYHENFERLKAVEKIAAARGAAVPQIVLAWVLAQPINAYPIIASTNIDHFKVNLEAEKIKLTAEELDVLSPGSDI